MRRNAPRMLADMRSWRENVREQSLRNFHHKAEWRGEQGEAHGVLSHTVITVLSLVVTVAGAGLAWSMFRRGTALEPQPAGVLVTAARRNLYTDAFNEAVFEKPGIYLTRALVYLDNRGIDGAVNGLAAAVGGGSGRMRRMQTGFVRSYALSMLTGAMLVVGAFLAIQLGWLA